ncbi:MAG TPA: 2OG-Fe(II) oxygenase [Terriglobales bacterium]|nr:2OG-Fe(II) oxygenase [Terriglobales bacterium]
MHPDNVPTSFSDFLINHNFVSPRERELLASILRHARASSDESPSSTLNLEAVLARAVGEVLLERAAETAGRDVLEQIRQQSFHAISAEPRSPSPSPSPHPPAPSPAPGPHQRVRTAEISARPPAPSPSPSPHPPAPSPAPSPHQRVRTAAAVQERPDFLGAGCVILDEFLAPEELQELMRYALGQERAFRISEVISPGVGGGVVDPENRRSRVLMDLGKHRDVVVGRIHSALPRVLEKLGMKAFPVSCVETQITASNHGDFFRHHSDNGEDEIANRQLTFVYFFHREPKAFHGGELRLHDSPQENAVWTHTGDYRAVVPEQNQMVFFRSELLHEITPVVCPSQAFADSRFTVNGWLHR